MCINADESEPATFNNRLLMEKDPHQFLEGILIACFATKATTAYHLPAVRVHPGLSDARDGDRRSTRGRHLGRNIYGTGFDLDSGCTVAPGRTSAARRPG